MPDLAAARMSDAIAHTEAMSGLLAGLGVGLLAGGIALAVVATGGLGAVAAVSLGAGIVGGTAGLAQLGMSIGEAVTTMAGSISAGSTQVFYEGLPAARAGVDLAACAICGVPSPIAQGSNEVFVDGLPAARKSSKTCCGSAISQGAAKVLLAGDTFTLPGFTIADDVPAWARTTLTVVTWTATLVGTGGAIAAVGWGAALGGFALGFVGGEAGAYAGAALGHLAGGELGARIGAGLGGLLGGLLGGAAGARLGRGAQALASRSNAASRATTHDAHAQPDIERTQPDIERTQPDPPRAEVPSPHEEPALAAPAQGPARPAPAQSAPAQRSGPQWRPSPTGLNDLPLDSLAEQSPSLTQQLREFQANGGTIEYGDANGGASYLHEQNRIVLDRSFRGNGRAGANLLSHELGHAHDLRLHPRDPNLPISGRRKLLSEGYAVINSLRVRVELHLATNGGVDIGVAGRGADIYALIGERLWTGKLTVDSAARIIARYVANERFPSAAGQPSRTYFEQYSANDPGCTLP